MLQEAPRHNICVRHTNQSVHLYLQHACQPYPLSQLVTELWLNEGEHVVGLVDCLAIARHEASRSTASRKKEKDDA